MLQHNQSLLLTTQLSFPKIAKYINIKKYLNLSILLKPMEFKETAFWKWWIVYGKHIEALAIVGLLILCWFTYYKNNKLQEKIEDKCGWEGEDYYCVCEKGAVLDLEEKLKNQQNPFYNLNFSFNIS